MSVASTEIINLINNKNLVVHNKSASVFEALEADNSSANYNAIASSLSEKINNELILVKNKLRPLMNDIAEKCLNKLNEVSSSSPITEYQIKTFEMPYLIEELIKQKIVAPRRDPMFLSKVLSIPTPAIEDIEKYFIHPVSSIDMYVQPLRDAIGKDGMLGIWNKYLSNISETNPAISSMGINVLSKVDEICLLFVVTNNLLDNIPEGVNTTEANYKEVVGEFYGEVCNFLAVANEHLSVFRGSRQLVHEIKDKTAVVDGVLYREYIENGGAPDAILGLIVSGGNSILEYNINTIKEKQEEHMKAWANYVKVQSYTSLDEQVNKHKVVYSIIMQDVYENLIPSDLKELLEVDHNTALSTLNTLLNSNKTDYVLDVELVARDIVGKCIFPNTNFQHFAEGITEYVKLNPNMTPADAATFASIDFIVDFMLEQVYLGGANGEHIDY